MQALQRNEFLELFDESVRERILSAAARNQATHVVCFENVMLDSSQLGARSALCIGPQCTYKTLQEIEGKRLGDVPSRFQYPRSYWACGASW